MEAKKILIVDDDKLLLDIYSRKFAQAGYEVEIGISGKDALEKIKPDSGYHFILLDVAMPAMNGFEVLEQLKASKLINKFPVIMLTNEGHQEEIDKATKLGAKSYIIKAQHTPSEVVKIVEGIIKG